MREIIGVGNYSSASNEGSNVSEISKVLEMMVVQNRCRDEVLERVLDQISNRGMWQRLTEIQVRETGYENEIKTFTEFVIMFEKTFLRIEGFPAKWKKMTMRIQHKGELLTRK